MALHSRWRPAAAAFEASERHHGRIGIMENISGDSDAHIKHSYLVRSGRPCRRCYILSGIKDLTLEMIDPLYVASGFGVGLLVGMTGVGGGSLMTPLLILLFGVHPSTAVGTDLLYAAATKTGGSLVHGWSQSIHWPAVIRLASGSIPASVVTLLVLWQLELNGEAARNLVNQVLCFALVLTAASSSAVTARFACRRRCSGCYWPPF